jgi:hypothetical protein
MCNNRTHNVYVRRFKCIRGGDKVVEVIFDVHLECT